jgi:hypothetical protein
MSWQRIANYTLYENADDVSERGYARIYFSEDGSYLEVNEKPWDPENKPQKIYFNWKDFEKLCDAITNSEFN